MKARDLFSLSDGFPFRTFFLEEQAPWAWVSRIKEVLAGFDFDRQLKMSEFPPGVQIDGPVFLDPTVVIHPNVVIQGPAYVGAQTEIRPGAFLRGNVIVGEGCVLGNSSEFKNCLLLDKVQVPHFNYVGDSILGNGAHLGAGVICSNLRLDQGTIWVKLKSGPVDSELRKLGALVGDGAEVGCNTVLNPGTILGRKSFVYPSMAFGGVLDANVIAASRQDVKLFKRH